MGNEQGIRTGESVLSTEVGPQPQDPQEWALLSRVLDGAPIGIVLLDRELRVLRVNSRAEAMFGVGELEQGGHRMEDVMPVMFAELKHILGDIIGGGASHLSIEPKRPTADVPWRARLYLAHCYPMASAEGAVIGVGCIFIDITRQRVAEGALLDSESERRAILGKMLRLEESERARLALELHDDTIQVLCALLLLLDGIIPLAKRARQDEIAARLDTARKVLADATERARKVMFELHPNVLQARGLRAAITALAEQIGSELNAEWTVDTPDAQYAWALEELAYRVVCEALTNVRKHSHARTFSVTLVETAGTLSGAVQDDGRGLDAHLARHQPNHLGVAGMKERARLAGGDVTVTSTQGHGVRVDFTLPIDHSLPIDHTPKPANNLAA
jgi:signal transduction histidine kinase